MYSPAELINRIKLGWARAGQPHARATLKTRKAESLLIGGQQKPVDFLKKQVDVSWASVKHDKNWERLKLHSAEISLVRNHASCQGCAQSTPVVGNNYIEWRWPDEAESARGKGKRSWSAVVLKH